MSSFGKDSAQLEREVDEQRRRVESRIGEIRERLTMKGAAGSCSRDCASDLVSVRAR